MMISKQNKNIKYVGSFKRFAGSETLTSFEGLGKYGLFLFLWILLPILQPGAFAHVGELECALLHTQTCTLTDNKIPLVSISGSRGPPIITKRAFLEYDAQW